MNTPARNVGRERRGEARRQQIAWSRRQQIVLRQLREDIITRTYNIGKRPKKGTEKETEFGADEGTKGAKGVPKEYGAEQQGWEAHQ